MGEKEGIRIGSRHFYLLLGNLWKIYSITTMRLGRSDYYGYWKEN